MQEFDERNFNFHTVSQYLKTDTYFIDKYSRVIFQKNLLHHPMIEKYKSEIGSDNFSLKEISINNEQNIFPGQILWFSADKGLKIFSHDEVLIFNTSKINSKEKLKKYDYFSKYFNIPELRTYDEKNNILSEELISFKDISNKSFLLKSIYKTYLNYFNHVSSHKIQMLNFSKIDYTNSPNIDFMNSLIEKIEVEIWQDFWPVLPLHGDLWSSNILIEENSNNFFVIDWDTSSDSIFFYDFFKFFWNELDVLGNTYLFNYLEGHYDKEFETLFKAIGKKFKKTSRKSYLYLFFINFLLDDTLSQQVKDWEIEAFKDKILQEKA